MKHAGFNLPFPATITDVQADNYRTKTIVLDVSISAYPGQFVMLWLPGFDEKPFSLVNDDPVTLMIREVGPFTRLIHDKRPGDRVWLRGSFGHGFCPPENDGHALLIGGGYGVAPLLWLARHLTGSDTRVTTIIGARTQSELVYADRFRALAVADIGDKHHGLYVASDDGTIGQKGLVTDVADSLSDELDISTIYACGPHGMLAAIRTMAQARAIPCQLSWEAYMRCGMGLCGACEFEGAVLCMDGPVLAFK